MWRGKLLEVLGLGLILTAFIHLTGSTTGWVGAVAGCLIVLVGTSLWHSIPRPATVANVAGLCLVVTALIPAFRIHGNNLWVAAIAGVITWAMGWRIVTEESGGPWRLKDRPMY